MYGTVQHIAPPSGNYGSRGAPQAGQQPGQQGGRSDFKEGRIFVGGLNYSTTKQSLTGYCSKWCVQSLVCAATLTRLANASA
jgi:hypothetical protein